MSWIVAVSRSHVRSEPGVTEAFFGNVGEIVTYPSGLTDLADLLNPERLPSR